MTQNILKRITVSIFCMSMIACSSSIDKRQDRYANGNIKSEYIIRNGQKNGISKEYSEAGLLKASFTWVDGKRKGVGKIYDEKSGTIKQVGHFENDTAEGPYVELYASGKTKTKGYFVKGQEEGFIKRFYQNGKIEKEYIALNGKLDSYGSFDSLGNVTSNKLFISVNFPDTVVQGKDFEIICHIFNADKKSGQKYSFHEAKRRGNIHWSLLEEIPIINNEVRFHVKAVNKGEFEWYGMLQEDYIDENGDKRGEALAVPVRIVVK